MAEHRFSANDHALMAEAVRRIEASRRPGTGERAAIASAVATAFLAGRRDLFGLVKAGSRLG